MNDRQLRRLLKRLLLTAPLPVALAGAACGGSATSGEPSGSAGTHPSGDAGSAGAVGVGGSGVGGSGTGGSGVAGSGAGGSGIAGSDTGGSGVGGSGVAGAGIGGSGDAGSGVGGSGGNKAGAGGGGGGASAGHGGGGGVTSAGGSGGVSGGGGGASGAAGANACMGSFSTVLCGSTQATVPRSCVDASMATVGTSLPSATCQGICGIHGSALGCNVTAVDATTITLNCINGCTTGRRPAGLCEPLAWDAGSLGAYFASVARLEAASVDAFRTLRDELRAHGAPKKLVRAAARAARDEVRHTRATGALARRFGARPDAVRVERGALRPIAAMALENAVEGCVRETYGALLATWQARAARDPVVRAAMKRIARDETRHAALSWDVGRWLETRLDPQAKSQIAAAKHLAARELLSSIANDSPPSFADLVGLPGPAQALQVAREMQRALWS